MAAVGILFVLIFNARYLADSGTLFIMLAPLFVGSLTLFLKGRPLHSLYLGAGVPLAVASSCVGFIGMLQNMSDPNAIQSATGLALTTLFWGGLLSSVGFALSLSHHADSPRLGSNRRLLAIMALIPIAFILIPIYSVSSLAAFYLPGPLLLVVAPAMLVIGMSKLRNRATEIHVLLQLVIIGTLGAVVVALIKYLIALDLFANEGNHLAVGEAIAEGILGLFYGSIILTLAAFCSHEGAFNKTSFLKLNWHLLEIFALWILMIFAPLTIREYLINYMS